MEMKQPKAKSEVVDALFAAGAHFGYSKSRRHPSIKPFIFGAKNRTEIIDLEKVEEMLVKAEGFMESLGQAGKQVMFVGNKPEAREAMYKAAESIGQPYSRERWIGGTLTNLPEIKKRLARLEDLERRKSSGELSIYPKKEILVMERELATLKRFFQGLLVMKSLPSALFVVDPKKESTAVSEAKKLGIPVLSLAGSDCDISNIDYPIVANDSSSKSITFFVEKLRTAYENGKRSTALAAE